MKDKRKIGVGLATLLVVAPYLTMSFMSGSDGLVTFSFMDIIFPSDNPLAQGFFLLKGVFYPILVLTVISVILNLVKKPFVILSAIVGVVLLGLHILFYFWVAEAFPKATLGIAWYIIGIGYIFLIVSPFLKSSNSEVSTE